MAESSSSAAQSDSGYYAQTAASLYESLATVRDQFLRRAEKAAALTIPMLCPRNSAYGRIGYRTFDTPRQGVGARGVNHLSSRLLLTLLPPGSPFFRFEIDPFARAVLAGDDKGQAEVEATLQKIEQTVQHEINTQAIRVTASEIFKHLIVAGNVLQYLPRKGGMRYYPLSQYVVVRDYEGDEIVDLIIKECLAFRALPTDIQDLVRLRGAYRKDLMKKPEDRDFSGSPTNGEAPDVEFFTRIFRISETRYRVRQELCDGTVIPESEGYYTNTGLPYHALRWAKVQNEAYGRGLVEEYLGDLLSLEALSQSLVEGALAASRVIGLIRPNGQTHPQDLNKAKNGEFVRGIGGENGDVTFLQLGKFADFRTSAEAGSAIQRRLEQAFLLGSGVIRDAERVTAEEVRLSAQELESTLGGVYTTLAHEFQLPLVNSIFMRLQRIGAVPVFTPKLQKIVRPVIVTGMDALGRNADLDRLRVAAGVAAEVLTPQVAAQWMDAESTLKFIYTNAGMSVKLVKTGEAFAQEQQDARNAAMMHEAVKGGVGPAVQAVSDASLQQGQQAAAAAAGQGKETQAQ